MGWTTEQESALEIKDKNILVSAAAGSGKTAALVERIIRLITDNDNPTNINEILVVTFTKAAAGEMKERVILALLNKIDEMPECEHLQRQVVLFYEAQITTIHSFCLDVIRNNYGIIGLTPDFRVADEVEISLILLDTVSKVFEEEYTVSNDIYFSKLVNSYTNGRDDRNLQDMIIGIYNKVRQISIDPIKWLEESVCLYKSGKDEELDQNMWIKLIKKQLHTDIERIIKDIREVLSELKSSEITQYIELISKEYESFYELKTSLDNGIEIFYKNLKEVVFDRLPRLKTEIGEELKTKVQKIRDVMKDFIKDINQKIFILPPNEMIKGMEDFYPVLKNLVDVVKKIDERFTAAKKERGIIDYSDIEHYTLDILTGNKKVTQNLREKYKYVFIDEYQDINLIQDTILTLVSKENPGYSNVFMVGDVKQSIYKFRQAKPEIFLQKYNLYTKARDEQNTTVDFTRNFRSRDIIINFVNFIFKQLMNEDLAGINYDEHAQLYLGAGYPTTSHKISDKIEFDIIDQKSQEDQDEELEDISKAEIEAKHVVGRINEIIKDGLYIYDKNLGQYRLVNYRDIVILIRSTKNYVEEYIKVFEKSGIPIYSKDDKGYFGSMEIRLILNILRVIDNPMYDIPLIAVLKSPIFGFTLDELVMIRNLNLDGCFHDALENCKEDKLQQKINNFKDRITRFRAHSETVGVRELLEKIYDDTDIYKINYCTKNMKLKNANLRLLIKRAEQYEETTFTGVLDFIRFVDKAIENNKDVASAKTIGENDDVVRIMTIHKSKGLEFPVVFLCGITKQFNIVASIKDGVLIHDEYGIGTDIVNLESNVIYKSPPKYIIETQIKKEIISEELRVLYVALTRAREKLYIVGVVNDYEKEKEKIGHQNYFKMLLSCVLKQEKLKEYNVKIDMKIFNKQDILDKDFENIVGHKAKEKNEVNKLDKNWWYRYEEANQYSRRLSVTNLKEGMICNKEIKVENKILELSLVPKSKLHNNTQKGIIVHRILKHIDYRKILSIDELEKELEVLLEKNIITSNDLRNIDKDKIYGFFSSDLMQRIKNSTKVYKEVPFVLEKNIRELYDTEMNQSVIIHGIIDCYFEENGGFVLVDYKTDYTDDESGEYLKIKYKAQLDIYEEALNKILDKEVIEKLIYSIYLNKVFIV
ncbi:MAG: helicase-exonuclease AddAB subunit AddA [Clostridiales bacterium GWE2_32_10]|nr:MAG: helicase-exonuclease AddAB subunit AddA [Clostridiales bacterium GWE2_32_10]